MSNVVAPVIQPPQQNPFEQAVIQAAAAAKKPQTHEPPKTSITITAPTQAMPQMPATPKFNAPIPGMAPPAPPAPPPPNPNGPPPATDPTTPAGMRALAAQIQAQDAQTSQQGLAALAAPAPQAIPYQQPGPAPRNMGQDIGTVLGTALFPHAAPAFARQAKTIDANIDKQHTEDIAAEAAKVGASQSAAQLAQSDRANTIARLQAAAQAGDKHAEDLLKQADIADRNANLARQADVKLAQAATNIADNRVKFATTFSGTMAKLGFQESKWGDQRSLDAAKQASLDTYRYQALGLRTENAYNIAQLRAASQMTMDAARMADQDKRANAGNQLRADIANNHDLQQTAMGAVRTIDNWTKATMALPPPQRAAAVAAMNAQLADPNSSLGQAMTALKQQGVFGESVGDTLSAEIQSSLVGQSVGPGGQPQSINVSPTIINNPAPASPPSAAPITPPAPAGQLPPHAVAGTVHLPGGQNVPGYQLNGHMFTMDGKPVQ